VAADGCIYALGSDTGGSIRQPASFCGVVGLKPTYGRVSRYGLMAMASSLDQIGPVTKTVEDCAIVLRAIEGKDKYDSTSVELISNSQFPIPNFNIKNLRVGIPKEYFAEGIDKEVEKLVKNAIKQFEKMGAKIEEVSLPYTEQALACYYIIMPSEVSANLARYDGIKYGFSVGDGQGLLDVYLKSRQKGFGDEARRRIMLGTYTLSAGYYDAYYLKAQKVHTSVKQDFDKAFEKVDILVTPTSPTPAFKIGEKIDDPIKMYLSDVYTVPINLAGVPAISVPCGEIGGLPVGLQIIGEHFDEETILGAAYAYEQSFVH
jgi:aspartyl-tRNA(Asn)/glutamyl-tRNA(Gln) amidotransferase subunit A